MKNEKSNLSLVFVTVLVLTSAALPSVASAETANGACSNSIGVFTPMSAANLKALDDVMKDVAPTSSNSARAADYAIHPIDGTQFDTDEPLKPIGMQIGRGGNPDVDKGKPFRDKSWSVSVLYPVKTTHLGSTPTTVYVEARCASLGQQPASAHTDNINVRCGPGIVGDAKLNSWLSAYGRIGLVTSRFSHNGAPAGQINPSTGKEYRLYSNNTGFTGAAIGAGVKVRLTSNTLAFAEYTKYKVQQTDNPAYQFRGGFNAGIARSFWLFQGPRN